MKINDCGNGKFIVDIEGSDELYAFLASEDLMVDLAKFIHKNLEKFNQVDDEVYFYSQDHYTIDCFHEYPTYYSDYAFMHYKLPVHKAIEYLYDLIPAEMIKLNKIGAFSKHRGIVRGFIR